MMTVAQCLKFEVDIEEVYSKSSYFAVTLTKQVDNETCFAFALSVASTAGHKECGSGNLEELHLVCSGVFCRLFQVKVKVR